MLISNVSGSPGSSQVDSYNVRRKERQALIQLAKAVAAGDVSEAQKAFATLQSLPGTSAERASQANSGVKTVQQDFQDLSTALASGNLSDARNVFVKLNNDLRASSVNGVSGRIHGTLRSHHRNRQVDVDTTTDTDAAITATPNTNTELSPSYTANGFPADVSPISFSVNINIYV